MNQNILIVDDETSMREFLSILLEREGYLTETADNSHTALKLLAEKEYELVISDVNMPGLDGIGLLEEIKANSPDTAVMMITAFSTTEQAVRAMKHGAYNYISKPFKVDEIKLLVRNAMEKHQLLRENALLRTQAEARNSFSGLIGKSRKMVNLYELIEKISSSNVTVMISGESGTGKELAAKAIHYNSDRRDRPFVAVNCGAIPETLMESELFGHAKGAFTGAFSDRPGLFEQANGGTLFLDEIGEVPILLQSKLLRALQEREIRRVGASENRKIDVRIITATNRNLELQVKEGVFREDLFYRLNVVEMTMPPLRERPEDITLLAEHFFKKYSGRRISKLHLLTPEALDFLWGYQFPGNVRELENIIERGVALGAGEITLELLPQQVLRFNKNHQSLEDFEIPLGGMDLDAYLAGIEKRFLLKSLEKSGGVRKKAAELLGMTFRSFRYKLAKQGMSED
ncbi:MAG: sigma-54-dependent Fis family transcriptional regulator [Geobacteraceae bacterium]|nr:sigma-54-dependent Fis family transcriptional regulator [Geobacteraceae bacterium]